MKTSIKTRDDLSFTRRDDVGRLINWPLGNPGVAADWEKGMAFFNDEIVELAAHDEHEALWAIKSALGAMCGRFTCLEIGFVDRIAIAAVNGLRAKRNGVAWVEDKDLEDIEHESREVSA